jgi:pilus assembly protein CpaB
MIAMQMTGTQQVVMQQAEAIIQREETVNVLVSAENLPIGSRLNEKAMRWANWPASAVVEGFITDKTAPQAMQDLNGAVVRMPLFAGEPVRREKIADSSSRVMSALLPAGKRAVATEISVSTGAGGFILPNDRVDIIMVRRQNGNFVTENVLDNIRVLAIDQQIQEQQDGSKAVIGTTATLELTPDQAKIISVAQQMAERLTLALRSAADAQDPDTRAASYLISGGSGSPGVQLIKAGQISTSNATLSSGSAPPASMPSGAPSMPPGAAQPSAMMPGQPQMPNSMPVPMPGQPQSVRVVN